MRMRNSPPSHSPSETSRSSGDDRGRQPGPLRQRRGGPVGAPQRRHEQARETLAGEPLGDRVRLRLALGCERRVAVAVDERERLALDRRRGRAVAHEDHLGRAGREREGALVVAVRHGGGVSQETAQR